MNTTYAISPTQLLTLKAVTPSSLAATASKHSVKALRKPVDRTALWQVLGCALVLAFILTAAAVWGWSFVQFVHLLIEMTPQPGNVTAFLQ
jgi:hypothetical protein